MDNADRKRYFPGNSQERPQYSYRHYDEAQEERRGSAFGASTYLRIPKLQYWGYM